jgi:hypothetical protein
MLARVIGVFKLDKNTFEEIEHNASLTVYAAIIVALVSLISGVGTVFSRAIFGGNVITGFLGSVIATLLGWLAWSVITWFVGTRFFNGQATVEEMLRVIGFAYTPLLLSIIPCIGPIVGGIWALVAGFVAVRQGLDLDNMKTFWTVVVGALAYIILSAIVNILL